MKHLIWTDEDATAAFARHLAGQAALRHAFIELEGDLGAGKTTFVRHLLRALGVQGRIKSPTYAVVEPYEVSDPLPRQSPSSAGAGATPLRIWHFDFYRFADPREWADAGFRDIFAAPGLKLAEWVEQARSALPPADLVIHLAIGEDDSRTVGLQANTAIGEALLA